MCCLPETLQETEIQLYIVYLISSKKKVNYKNNVKNMNTNETRSYGTGIISCNFANSKCLKHRHGHIIPRDLQITMNKTW